MIWIGCFDLPYIFFIIIHVHTWSNISLFFLNAMLSSVIKASEHFNIFLLLICFVYWIGYTSISFHLMWCLTLYKWFRMYDMLAELLTWAIETDAERFLHAPDSTRGRCPGTSILSQVLNFQGYHITLCLLSLILIFCTSSNFLNKFQQPSFT